MGRKEKDEARAKRRKNKFIKKISIWVLVLLGIGAIIFYFAVFADKNGQTDDVGGTIPPITERDWVKWNTNSSVTLVEYSDFQCPACAEYFKLINAVELEYGGKVAFVYRHYPLTQIHFNSNAAARAAEAAGVQGKFWEMHDMLFQTQELWSTMTASDAAAVFAGYARDTLRINVDQYLSDFDSEVIQDRVTEGYSGGLKAGVNSTPTFFINGKKIKNPADIAGFRTLLDEALANAETNSQ